MHSWQVCLPLGSLDWFFCLAGWHGDRIPWVNKTLPDRDPFIFPLVMILCGWGLLEIWRLSAAFGMRQTVWLAYVQATLLILSSRPAFLDLLRRYKISLAGRGADIIRPHIFIGTYPEGTGRIFGWVYLVCICNLRNPLSYC
jgi:hypothetical protein